MVNYRLNRISQNNAMTHYRIYRFHREIAQQKNHTHSTYVYSDIMSLQSRRLLEFRRILNAMCRIWEDNSKRNCDPVVREKSDRQHAIGTSKVNLRLQVGFDGACRCMCVQVWWFNSELRCLSRTICARQFWVPSQRLNPANLASVSFKMNVECCTITIFW